MTNQMIHPALAQAPKTLREALDRALAYTKANGLAQGVYKDQSAKCCVIGQFLTEEQLDDIRNRGLNNQDVDKVFKIIGSANMKAMTGLNSRQAQALQDLNDLKGAGKLQTTLHDLLQGNKFEVSGIPFKLEAK